MSRGRETSDGPFDVQPHMRIRFVSSLVVATLMLGACGSPAQAPAAQSGVEGTVTYGPTCPVARAGSPCPPRPWQGTVRALGLDGVTVRGTVATDQAGVFKMDLPPGGYFITPVTPEGPPTTKMRRLTVMAGAYTSVELSVDTGIR